MGKIEFEIPGKPIGKGRPRMTRAGHTYTPKETVNYENLVKTCYPGDMFPDGSQLCVSIIAWYQIPKSVSKKKREEMIMHTLRPTVKPDLDNIAKSVCDALNGVAYRDDSMIVQLTVQKLYSDVPKVSVTIYDL